MSGTDVMEHKRKGSTYLQATQSGCSVDHCKLLIGASALYARIGSSIALGMGEISQISA